jgi:hypothetical protein
MGLVVIGHMESMVLDPNSSIVKSSFFPKIIEIMEIILREFSGNNLDWMTILSSGALSFLHRYDCRKVTLSSCLISLKHLVVIISFKISLARFNGRLNIS